MNAGILKFVEKILKCFRKCFSRFAAWFVVLVFGFMLRSDKLGVTSVIRDLGLGAGTYINLMNFFRAKSWNLTEIRTCWHETVKDNAPLCTVNGRIVFLGDGVKQAKDGRKMPGVKKMHQESDDAAKAEYIYGHMFGGLGILAGEPGNWLPIPLNLAMHDGLRNPDDEGG